ncbi:MAG: DUF4350 domain-containing protein [Bacteroidota bacterium]
MFILLVFLESSRKKPLSWKETFCGRDKIPYGTYVLKHLLMDLYPENSFVESSDGIYRFTKISDNPEQCKFIYITNNFSLKNEVDEITMMVKNGNDVFIASEYFDRQLGDTLGFSTKYNWTGILDSNRFTSLHYTKPDLEKEQGYQVNEALTGSYFAYEDSVNTTVLAEDMNRNPVFIKIRKGKGDFYLCSTPLLFTNYNILYGNTDYPFIALSFLRGNKIIWDEYYKPFKPEIETPLRYIQTQPALKAAYVLLIIALILYFLFEGKRRQKVIPVIRPPQNLSLEFVKTVGRLYFNNGNNRDIAMKKYFHFCDYIRNKYQVKSITVEPDFFKMLSERSGVNVETVSVLFKLANHIQNQSWTGDDVLMSFNEKIEEFYNRPLA